MPPRTPAMHQPPPRAVNAANALPLCNTRQILHAHARMSIKDSCCCRLQTHRCTHADPPPTTATPRRRCRTGATHLRNAPASAAGAVVKPTGSYTCGHVQTWSVCPGIAQHTHKEINTQSHDSQHAKGFTTAAARVQSSCRAGSSKATNDDGNTPRDGTQGSPRCAVFCV